MFTLPESFINVTDDDINEPDQSFAIVAELADVPERVACFRTSDTATECSGRFGTTTIRIRDNDRE